VPEPSSSGTVFAFFQAKPVLKPETQILVFRVEGLYSIQLQGW
jgi:hypothetical protein